MPSIIQFTPFSGVRDEEPYCYMLDIDGFRILLDCGWYDTFDTTVLEPLKRSVSLPFSSFLIFLLFLLFLFLLFLFLLSLLLFSSCLLLSSSIYIFLFFSFLFLFFSSEKICHSVLISKQLFPRSYLINPPFLHLCFFLFHFFSLSRVAKTIDAVLISHPDLKHAGGLPYAFAKLGFTCPIYAALPVYDFAKVEGTISSHLIEERDI